MSAGWLRLSGGQVDLNDSRSPKGVLHSRRCCHLLGEVIHLWENCDENLHHPHSFIGENKISLRDT